MNELSHLKKPRGSTHRKLRVGRGQASGTGKTAGRGGKGQKARVGNMHFGGFEGGQMPLSRRLPKRGFTNINKREFQLVKVEQLAAFEAGATVGPDELRGRKLLRKPGEVKVLGDGDLAVALTVRAHAFSASAKSKIEAAGGKTELIAAE